MGEVVRGEFCSPGTIPGNTDSAAYPNCEKALPASSGEKPRMLPNIPQFTGELTTTKNYPAQEVTSAEAGNPALKFEPYCNRDPVDDVHR